MPFSSQSGKGHIKRVINRVPHARMLDIGCGSGTYAKMFPDAHWTGIEIWEPYVEEYGLRDLYKDLIVSDIRKHLFDADARYDVAIAGDVLEHMTIDEAKGVLKALRLMADTVIVSIPIVHYPQDAWNGNPHEKHIKDDWTDTEVRDIFGQPDWSVVDNEIGIYVWSKHKVDLRIAIYAICKDEEQFVKRFCESARDADCIVIADTGSTDRTVELAREHGAQVYSICVAPWRFDLPRNAAMALIPRDIDVCISLDLDELMEPGWRQEIERCWKHDTTNLWYLFDWGCDIVFPYHKIHSRHGWKWVMACHEDLENDPRVPVVNANSNKVLVSHHPDTTKSRGQYMPLLEAAIKEDDTKPQHYFYYSRELTFYGRWEEAKTALLRYLDMKAASNQNERCYAMRLLGKTYDHLGSAWEAEAWYMRACAEAPNTREPWCELAMLYYRQSRWKDCLYASTKALDIKDKALVYTCDPAVWGHWAHDLASVAAWNLGLKDIALEQAKLAVAKTPDDARLQANLNFIVSDSLDKAA